MQKGLKSKSETTDGRWLWKLSLSNGRDILLPISLVAGAVAYINCISAEAKPPHSSYECAGYDTKQSDCKASALEIWGMWSTPSLPLLQGPPDLACLVG